MPEPVLGYSEQALADELREWWDEEVVGTDDPFAAPPTPSGTIQDVQPVVDSLGVVKRLVVIDKHVGFQVPPSVVRRGGYHSFEDMVGDLLPKLRALWLKRQKKLEAA